MNFETERLILRQWREADFEPFAAMCSDPKVMEYFPKILSREETHEMVGRIQKHFDAHNFGLYACEEKKSDSFIGFVGLQHVPFEAQFTPAVEIGWRIASNYWNQGFATEAALAILDFAAHSLQLPEILALTYKGNMKSRRVMEKLGMTYNASDDFLNPHPAIKGTWLEQHVVYRKTLS